MTLANIEQYRYELLRLRIDNGGSLYANVWVWQTLRIYRRAVLDKRHFASKGFYRRRYIEAYLNLRMIITKRGLR